MKRLLVVLVIVPLTASFFVVPVAAKSVFKVSIIPCGAPGQAGACGTNPVAVDPLIGGSVDVSNTGQVKVDLKGAAPNAVYRVWVGYWDEDGGFWLLFSGSSLGHSIGTVSTNAKGSYRGPIITDEEEVFVFPPGTAVIQPNFAFNRQSLNVTQFTTGFKSLGGAD